MPKFSVKRPYVTLVAVVMVLVLGGVSFSKMTTIYDGDHHISGSITGKGGDGAYRCH